MDDQLVVKYIRTKKKLRKIVTYKENGELRQYHEAVNEYLRKNTFNSIFAKAYVPKSSIYKNAEAHMYNDIFLKMDIKNFFPNLNHKYMSECLYHEVNKKTKISRKECYDIIRKCSIGNKGLPLGLVTSPALANLYMKEFDGILYGKLRKIGIENPIYTRFADDMIISFKYMVDYMDKINIIKYEVDKLLSNIHLSLNNKKTSITDLRVSNHVRVTGISITKDKDNYRRISVGKKIKNEIFWESLNMYDNKEENGSYRIKQLKGLFSFVLSVEKNGIDDSFSEGMHNLLYDRGFDNIKQLIDAL